MCGASGLSGSGRCNDGSDGTPHPGAQLRFTDSDGHRITGFITDTPDGLRQFTFRRSVPGTTARRGQTFLEFKCGLYTYGSACKAIVDTFQRLMSNTRRQPLTSISRVAGFGAVGA